MADTTAKPRRKQNPKPGKPEPRMEDVAALAAVSAMTVSRALRDPTSVNTETRLRIEAAIDATGYVPNRIAGSLASRRTNVVGLIVPSLRNSLFAETIQGVSDGLGTHHPLMIADSGYALAGEEAAIRAFLAQRICGIVLHNTQHTARSRSMLEDAGIPCVETGNLTKKPLDMAVGFSNYDAAYAMTEYLIGRGYKKIGFVSLPIHDNDRAAERRAGFLAAHQRRGLISAPELLIESPPGLRSGGLALATLIERVPAVDAVFLSGDVLATGALLEANRRGLDVPNKIAIVGSDDNELQETVSPPLTTLRFPRYQIGHQAAEMLMKRLRNPSRDVSRLDLGYELIERASA